MSCGQSFERSMILQHIGLRPMIKPCRPELPTSDLCADYLRLFSDHDTFCGLSNLGFSVVTWVALERPKPGSRKNRKICKISVERLVFSPRISYITLRWNAVNAVKLCKFTARVSGDLTKIHHNSPLNYLNLPPVQGFEPLTSCRSSTAPSLLKTC